VLLIVANRTTGHRSGSDMFYICGVVGFPALCWHIRVKEARRVVTTRERVDVLLIVANRTTGHCSGSDVFYICGVAGFPAPCWHIRVKGSLG